MTNETKAQSLVDEVLANLDHAEKTNLDGEVRDMARGAMLLIREQQALIAKQAAPVAVQDELRAKAENFVARMRKGAKGARAAERELEDEDADEAQACAVQAYIQEDAAAMVEQLLAAAPTPPAQQSQWVPIDRAPEVAAGKMKWFLVSVYRDFNKRQYTFMAAYMNGYQVANEDYDPDADDYVALTGWHEEAGDHDEPYWRKLFLAEGDKLTHWMPLPAAPGDTAPPEQSHPVNRSVIRDVFLRNGFTIKEGHDDLKPYVYAAAEELLALDGKEIAAEQGAVTVPRELLGRITRNGGVDTLLAIDELRALLGGGE